MSLLVLAMLPTYSFGGEVVNIYCSNSQNRAEWYRVSLKKFGVNLNHYSQPKIGNYSLFPLTVSGEWITVDEYKPIYSPTCQNEIIFVIDEEDYLKVKDACPNNFFLQPVSSGWSLYWYRFAVKNNFGIRVLPGHTSFTCKPDPLSPVG